MKFFETVFSQRTPSLSYKGQLSPWPSGAASFSAPRPAFAKRPTPAETSFHQLKKIFFQEFLEKTGVADDIISAVADFTWKHSRAPIKNVTVAIFKSELLNVFCDHMKKREISVSPTLPSTSLKTACKMFFKKSCGVSDIT